MEGRFPLDWRGKQHLLVRNIENTVLADKLWDTKDMIDIDKDSKKKRHKSLVPIEIEKMNHQKDNQKVCNHQHVLPFVQIITVASFNGRFIVEKYKNPKGSIINFDI
jgi:hypothetical protein